MRHSRCLQAFLFLLSPSRRVSLHLLSSHVHIFSAVFTPNPYRSGGCGWGRGGGCCLTWSQGKKGVDGGDRKGDLAQPGLGVRAEGGFVRWHRMLKLAALQLAA